MRDNQTRLDRPLVCPVLVGRGAHRAALEACLDQACAGRGQLVLVHGEAGIGKSRLLETLRARAVDRGARVVQGACFEPDHVVPFAPFIDVLRDVLADAEAASLLATLGPAAAELAALAPDLAVPDAGGRADSGPQQQRRLFHALERLVGELTARQPLLLVLEDVHWSDEATLECVQHLARRLAPMPILFVLTFRAEEVTPPLARLLSAVERGRLGAELSLARLGPEQVGEMIEATLGLRRPPRPELVRQVHRLTEGNPFFVEEVLRSLVATGDIVVADDAWLWGRPAALRIPRSVQEAIERQSHALVEGARQTLTLAAVIGQRCDTALLQAVVGLDDAALDEHLRQLVGVGLLIETAPDQLTFRHALTREAVLGTVLARQRQALHRRVVETLERLYTAPDAARLGELAYHSYAAADWSRTLRYAQLAGEQATRLYAPSAAAEHFRRAIEAAGHLGQPVPHTVHRAHGLALEALGAFEPARTELEAALERAQAEQDVRGEWQTLLDLALLWAGRDYRRTGDYVRRALDAARAWGDQSSLAHTLNRLGNWHLNLDQAADGIPLHREALGLFDGLGEPQGVAETLDLLGLATYVSGDLLGGTAHMDRAVVLFREVGDRQGLASSLATRLVRHPTYQTATLVPDLVPFDVLRREITEAVEAARAIDWRPGEAFALFNAGYGLAGRGVFEEALRLTTASLRVAEEVEHRQWTCAAHAVLGAIHHDLLDFATARSHLDQARRLAEEVGSIHWLRRASGLLALLLVEQRDLAAAAQVIDASWADGAPARSWGQRLLALARAELCLARSEPDRALTLAEALIASAPNTEVRPIPQLLRVRAAALLALGRADEAEQALAAGLAVPDAWGWWPLAWRFRCDLGRVLRAQGRVAAARSAFGRAWQTAEAGAAGIADERLRAIFLDQVARRVPPAAREPAADGGLTQREREVAALVAAGRSNKEIADTLVLGERTIETHVSNILGKLGLRSRAQIAAWAVEHGLTAPPY